LNSILSKENLLDISCPAAMRGSSRVRRRYIVFRAFIVWGSLYGSAIYGRLATVCACKWLQQKVFYPACKYIYLFSECKKI